MTTPTPLRGRRPRTRPKVTTGPIPEVFGTVTSSRDLVCGPLFTWANQGALVASLPAERRVILLRAVRDTLEAYGADWVGDVSRLRRLEGHLAGVTSRPIVRPPVAPLQDRPHLVVIHRLDVASPADPYLGLQALSTYSNCSVRWLRDRLTDSSHPLPCFRLPGGKILVRRSAFDTWLAAFAQRGDRPITEIVGTVLARLRRNGREGGRQEGVS